MIAQTFVVTLVHITCPGCGGLYAISQQYKDEAHRLGGFKKCWTCPYCKEPRGYGESAEDRLNKQIASITQDRDWQRNRAESSNRESERLRKSRSAVRGQLTKVKNRVAAGVCPCCNRTFENLARHMAGQHPNFTAIPSEES